MSWQDTTQAISVALGTLFLSGTLIVGLVQLKHLRRQVNVTASEYAARVRPWVGLTGIHLVRAGRQSATDGSEVETPPDPKYPRIRLVFANVGAVPAHDLEMDLWIVKFEGDEEQVLEADDLLRIEVGTIFPGESSDRYIMAKLSSGLGLLVGEARAEAGQMITSGKHFMLRGLFRYSYTNSEYQTGFRASFEPDLDRFVAWRNVAAT